MSSPPPNQMSSPSTQRPTPTVSNVPDTVTLHVLSPSAEVPDGRITFPSIPLETTIAHLKSRIQNSIAAAPPPERQRLIYRGRPLVDLTLTLRRVFHSELSVPHIPPSLSLHLVLPPGPAALPNGLADAPVNRGLGTPDRQQGLPPPPPPPPPPPHINQALPHVHHHHPHHHGQHLLHQALAPAQVTQMMLQNLLQQQQQQQQQVGANNLPIAQGQGRMNPSQGVHALQNPPNAHPPTRLPQFPAQMPDLQALIALGQQQILAQGGLQGTHNQMHGQQIHGNAQGVQNAAGILPDTHGGGMTQMPMTTTIHETIGPDGQRTRVVVNETMNLQISRQGTPVPPAHAGNVAPDTRAIQNVLPRGITVPHAPARSPDQRHLDRNGNMIPSPILGAATETQRTVSANNQQQQSSSLSAAHSDPLTVPEIQRLFPSEPGQRHMSTTSSAPSTNTTAWLLSSPSGPQALVFAPGHGYFSSPMYQRSSRFAQSSRTSRHITGLRFQQTPNGRIRPQNLPEPAANNANPARAQVVRRQGQVQVNNDLFILAFQRGWLFLRLYIFMFFLSEPGTWRHWFFLFLAVVVCLMPRAPARDLFNYIRGTIDDLLAPPPAPRLLERRRQEGSGAQGGVTDESRRGGAEPTPEEAAARLRQNRNRQRHNIFRETFYRVERAAAMFIASLVPGVGERHVRAREDARREAERIENERAATEATRAENQAASNEEKRGDISTSAAGASGEPSMAATSPGENSSRVGSVSNNNGHEELPNPESSVRGNETRDSSGLTEPPPLVEI